jgi:hypothetical protein
VALPEPGPGDEQHREGDQVAADDEFELGPRGVQVGVDRRRRDVGDRHVGLGHEGREEQDGQQPVRVRQRRGRRGHADATRHPSPRVRRAVRQRTRNEKRATTTARGS